METDKEDPLLIAGYKVKDIEIKDKCATEEWANAIVYLLYQNWKPNAVCVLKDNQDEDDDTFISLRKK